MKNEKYMTIMESFIKYVRLSPIFKQYIPIETISSWPILDFKNNKVYVTILYYTTKNIKPGKTLIYPPIALITLEYKTKCIIKYINCANNNLNPASIGYFPHEAIKDLTVKDYRNLKAKLMSLYDIMISGYLENQLIKEDIKNRFSKLLSLLVEPELIVYYKKASPQFVNDFIKN